MYKDLQGHYYLLTNTYSMTLNVRRNNKHVKKQLKEDKKHK